MRQLITTIDDYDLDNDGLADITVIMRNGEKGIYVSFRALALVTAACIAVVTQVMDQIF